MGLIPGSGIYPGRGYSDPRRYSCLENPVDRGAWRATVYGATKSRIRWKQLSTYTLCVRVRRTQSLRARVWVHVCVCVYHPWESRGPGPQREITPRIKVQGRFLSPRGEWALEPGKKRGEPEPQRGKWGLPHKGDAVHAGVPQLLEPHGLEREGGEACRARNSCR